MTALDKTIGNLRIMAKSKLDAVSYENWKKIIHEATVDYIKLFSEIKNSLFLLAQKEESGLTKWFTKIKTGVSSLRSKYSENQKLEKRKLFGEDIGEEEISKIAQDEEAIKSKKDILLNEIIGVSEGKEFVSDGKKEEVFLEKFLALANEFKEKDGHGEKEQERMKMDKKNRERMKKENKGRVL